MSRLSRIGFSRGWLAYAAGEDTALSVTGPVLDAEISVRQQQVNVTSIASPQQAYVAGPVEVTVRADLGYTAQLIRGRSESEVLWDLLRTWAEPDACGQDGRRWPPQFRAMAELARRYPEEYRQLLEAERAAEPLRVTRHDWIR